MGTKQFIQMIWFNPHNNPVMQAPFYPHFTMRKAKCREIK